MPDAPATIIIRHQKENLAKCSLKGISARAEVKMLRYPLKGPIDLTGRIALTLDAPPLSRDDADTGLVLLDATWRHAERMTSGLRRELATTIPRSLPGDFVTAYPRCQTACPDPTRGLASIEALFIAYHLLGRDTTGLLDHYLWHQQFLESNAALLSC